MPVEWLAALLAALLAAGTTSPPDGNPPSVEMLEFLGGFETASGQWIDPAVFDANSGSEGEARAGGDAKREPKHDREPRHDEAH